MYEIEFIARTYTSTKRNYTQETKVKKADSIYFIVDR